jgi:hypothetical protein
MPALKWNAVTRSWDMAHSLPETETKKATVIPCEADKACK